MGVTCYRWMARARGLGAPQLQVLLQAGRQLAPRPLLGGQDAGGRCRLGRKQGGRQLLSNNPSGPVAVGGAGRKAPW